MEKFKKFCKKPLAFISLGVLVLFIIGIIIMNSIPYTEATYSYKSKDFSIEIEVEEDEVTITTDEDGKLKISEYDAYIKNGKLYIKLDRASSIYTAVGKIDSHKINMYKEIIGKDIKLECTLTKVLTIVDIVVISVASLALIGSVVLILIDKNKQKEDK